MNEVQLANKALSYLGQSPIQSLDERRNEAALAKLYLPDTILEVLRVHPWSCAKAWRVLAELDPEDWGTLPDSWSYAFALPADCLTPRYLSREGAAPGDSAPAFELYTNPGGGDDQILLTNESAATLVYTKRGVPVSRFTPDLCDAIAWKLAIALALPITRTETRLNTAQIGYERALSAARTTSSNEEPENALEPEPEWITARG